MQREQDVGQEFSLDTYDGIVKNVPHPWNIRIEVSSHVASLTHCFRPMCEEQVGVANTENPGQPKHWCPAVSSLPPLIPHLFCGILPSLHKSPTVHAGLLRYLGTFDLHLFSVKIELVSTKHHEISSCPLLKGTNPHSSQKKFTSVQIRFKGLICQPSVNPSISFFPAPVWKSSILPLEPCPTTDRTGE